MEGSGSMERGSSFSVIKDFLLPKFEEEDFKFSL
jgi:hypothetical protein